MADDRKKMLEALAAKRKAEAMDPRSYKKPVSAGSKPNPSLMSEEKKGKPYHSPLKKPSVLAHSDKKKNISMPKKKKRVEKYESEEGSDDGSVSSEEEDSDVPGIKHTKKAYSMDKGKDPGPKKKSTHGSYSSDGDGGCSDDVDDVSGDEGVDPSNILPTRTRRHNRQPVQSDFGGMDDDEDSD